MREENGWLESGVFREAAFLLKPKKAEETKTLHLGKVQGSKSKQGMLPSEDMVSAKTLMC